MITIMELEGEDCDLMAVIDEIPTTIAIVSTFSSSTPVQVVLIISLDDQPTSRNVTLAGHVSKMHFLVLLSPILSPVIALPFPNVGSNSILSEDLDQPGFYISTVVHIWGKLLLSASMQHNHVRWRKLI